MVFLSQKIYAQALQATGLPSFITDREDPGRPKNLQKNSLYAEAVTEPELERAGQKNAEHTESHCSTGDHTATSSP